MVVMALQMCTLSFDSNLEAVRPTKIEMTSSLQVKVQNWFNI